MISQGQDSRVESAWEDKEHLDPQQLWRAVRASLSSGMKIWIAGSCIFLWSKQNLWWHSATPKQVLGWSTAFFPVKPLVYCTAHSVLRKWVTLFQILFPLCSYIQAKINQNYEQLLPFIIQSWRRPDVFAASRFTLEMNPSLRPSWQGAEPQRLISPSTIRWIPLSPAANHPPKMPPRAGKLATVAHEMQGASKRCRRVEVSINRSLPSKPRPRDIQSSGMPSVSTITAAAWEVGCAQDGEYDMDMCCKGCSYTMLHRYKIGFNPL